MEAFVFMAEDAFMWHFITGSNESAGRQQHLMGLLVLFLSLLLRAVRSLWLLLGPAAHNSCLNVPVKF